MHKDQINLGNNQEKYASPEYFKTSVTMSCCLLDKSTHISVWVMGHTLMLRVKSSTFLRYSLSDTVLKSTLATVDKISNRNKKIGSDDGKSFT